MGGGSGLLMDDVSRVVLDRGGGFGFSLLLPPLPPLMDSLVVEEVRQMPESSKELLQLPPRLWWKLLGGIGGGCGSFILLTVIGGSELVRLPELSSLSLPLSLRFSSPEVF